LFCALVTAAFVNIKLMKIQICEKLAIVLLCSIKYLFFAALRFTISKEVMVFAQKVSKHQVKQQIRGESLVAVLSGLC
jgi:hypothetical protein